MTIFVIFCKIRNYDILRNYILIMTISASFQHFDILFFKNLIFETFLGLFYDDLLYRDDSNLWSNEEGSSSVPRPPQFNTEGPLLFSPQNPSVPHQKPLSSTHSPQFHTKKALYKQALQWLFYGVELRGFWCWSEGFLVWNWGGWNWGIFAVELRGFWCWTERFLVWNWGTFGAEKVWS